mgnify:FL=1
MTAKSWRNKLSRQFTHRAYETPFHHRQSGPHWPSESLPLLSAKKFPVRHFFLFITTVCFITADQGGFKGFGETLPPYVLYPTGFGFGIIFLIVFARFRKALKPSNWVLKLGMDRVLIKYRSCLNSHLPEEDPVVVEISLSEIQWVRKTNVARLNLRA